MVQRRQQDRHQSGRKEKGIRDGLLGDRRVDGLDARQRAWIALAEPRSEAILRDQGGWLDQGCCKVGLLVWNAACCLGTAVPPECPPLGGRGALASSRRSGAFRSPSRLDGACSGR